MYFAFFHSHIAFGIALYGSTSVKSLKYNLVAQKKQFVLFKILNGATQQKMSTQLGIMTSF